MPMHMTPASAYAAVKRGAAFSFLVAFLPACGSPAVSFCKKLEEAKVAENCREAPVPKELPLSDARSSASFALKSGGEGRVYVFESEAIFNGVVEAERVAGQLGQRGKNGVSLHQGYVKARTIVTLSTEATAADESATRIALGQNP